MLTIGYLYYNMLYNAISRNTLANKVLIEHKVSIILKYNTHRKYFAVILTKTSDKFLT
jgi:hypothetical protein